MNLELFNRTALTESQVALLGDGIDLWEQNEGTSTKDVSTWVARHGSTLVLFESIESLCAEDNEWRSQGTSAWILTDK